MRTFFIVLLLAVSQIALAQSLAPDYQMGTRAAAFNARSLGLGHCVLTDQPGASSLLGNPATMAEQTTRWKFDVSGDIARVEETRKYPVYDAFAGVLTWNNYAVNDHLHPYVNAGVSYLIPLAGIPRAVVSAGTYSVYRFDYLYEEEVRDRYSSGGMQDRRVGDNLLESKGDLRSFSLGGAITASKTLDLGFGVSLLSGKWNIKRGVYYVAPDSNDIEERHEYKPSGMPMEFNLGALAHLSPRVVVGARAVVPTGFEMESSTDSVFSLPSTYPTRLGAGIEYRPQAEFQPRLMLEGEFVGYKSVDNNYYNVFEIRAGAEQQIIPGAPVRLGFVYGTAPDNKDRATTLFTAGIGFSVQKFTTDLGMEIGQVNYIAPDLFPQALYGGVNRIDPDRVETNLLRGMITLRYSI